MTSCSRYVSGLTAGSWQLPVSSAGGDHRRWLRLAGGVEPAVTVAADCEGAGSGHDAAPWPNRAPAPRPGDRVPGDRGAGDTEPFGPPAGRRCRPFGAAIE